MTEEEQAPALSVEDIFAAIGTSVEFVASTVAAAASVAELVVAELVRAFERIRAAIAELPPEHDDDLVVEGVEGIPRDHGYVRVSDGVVLLHPLEAIRLEYEGDPIGEVRAACQYIADRACAELDELEARLTAPTHAAAIA